MHCLSAGASLIWGCITETPPPTRNIYSRPLWRTACHVRGPQFRTMEGKVNSEHLTTESSPAEKLCKCKSWGGARWPWFRANSLSEALIMAGNTNMAGALLDNPSREGTLGWGLSIHLLRCSFGYLSPEVPLQADSALLSGETPCVCVFVCVHVCLYKNTCATSFMHTLQPRRHPVAFAVQCVN